MGITGLIPFLEKASSEVHLRDLRGCSVAVDTYCWLHKGVFSCAEQLARGEDTDRYVQYCLRYVQMLLAHDIKPILVFDGRHLPAKAQTELRRRESRQNSKRLAQELLRAGRVDEARSHMRRCVDVTHEMALRLIRACRLRNVDCVVAPYEADAQLAWLNKVELAEYVITEDSDLTLFGARKIIFKLNLNGVGRLVNADKLHLAMGCPEAKYTFDKFRRMCILSGCDYLDSLPGIGLAKACKFMLMTEEDDMCRALKKIPAYLNMRDLEVTENYIDNFLKAEATFRHMYIFNTNERRMERLYSIQDYDTEISLCSNAGKLLDDETQAFQLALGNLNPFTLKILDNWHPDYDAAQLKQQLPKGVLRAKHKSIWAKDYYNKNQKPSAVEENALHFKKVDFVSKTVDEEIRDTLTEEHAKPAEADVYSMYSCSHKKYTSSISKYECAASSSIMITPPKNNCNPFAIKRKTPPVCENGSLLQLLTPKKSKEKETAEISAQISEPIIKSRFFSQQTAVTPTKPKTTRCALSFQSPDHKYSPHRKLARLDEDVMQSTVAETKTNSLIVLLSDEEIDAEDNKNQKITAAAKVVTYPQRQRLPRLGLSRPKTTTRSITKSAKQTPQTQLSQFGFQRRPVLK